MAILIEARRSAGYIVSESNGWRSRDQGTFVNGTGTDIVLLAGTVLAASAASDVSSAAAGAGGGGSNTGNGTIAAFNTGAEVDDGTYVVKFTGATTFTVTDPRGDVMANGTTGAAYATSQIGFTITVGGTPFVAGDGFAVTVALADTSYYVWNNTGTAVALSVNTQTVPANSTGRIAVLTRAAEINAAEIQFGVGVTTPQQATAMQQLARVGIISRPGV